MKILHTIYGLNKQLGGPSSCTYNLVKGLNLIGVNTEILTLASKNPSDDIGHEDFIHYEKNDSKTPLQISHNFKAFLNKFGNNYDIIHANTIWLWHTHQASRFAHDHNKPLVLSPHGMLYPQALKVSSWKKKLILPLFQCNDLKKADLLHATSTAEMKHIRDFGLMNPIAVIPNMLLIDAIPEVRSTTNSIKRFGFVGRINRIKNIDLLLKAWSQVKDYTNHCELIIIGSGDETYESELKQFVKDNNIKNIRFEGFKSGKVLTDLVNSLDYQILPSKSENFGMVVPEALINGVPVIASTGTPWEDLNSHNCGWWIDADVDVLAETIKTAILTSEEDRREMGKNGRHLVINKYLSDKVATHMKQAYEWLINGLPKPDFIYD